MREYLACIKNNFFIIVQICLALVLINLQVGSIAREVERLSNIEDTDESTYFFQYAMAAGGLFNIGDGDYAGTCEKIKSLPGIEDIGEIFNSSIIVDEGSAKESDEPEMITINAMDSIVTEAITYRMKEGRWLTESDRDKEVIYAVLGGEIAKKHEIGDRISVETDLGEMYEMEVVGKLPEHSEVLYMYVLTQSQSMYSFMQPVDNIILVNNKKVFNDLKRSGFGYSNAHCIVKLNENADKEYLSNYGKIVSIEEMKQETEEELHDFIKETIETSIIWAVVIIFGIIATSYLVGKNRRYVWGIYLLLGEKPKQLLKMHMINNVINYVAGVIISLLIVYQIYLRDEMLSEGISRYHIMADAVFIFIMLIISLLSNAYIMKLEPKEILTQTKE